MPAIGDTIKVHLPGESPWAECLAVHDDGSWDGKIINKLIHEYSEHERAQFTKRWFGTAQPLPKAHDFKQGQIIRFCPDEDMPHVWVPAA